MNDKIKDILKASFKDEEFRKIEEFLNKGFSQNGQIAIASIFLFAQDHKKPITITEILTECEKEWNRNWQYQHPDIKGDADAPGAAGIQNRFSLENIYKAIQVPSPSSK